MIKFKNFNALILLLCLLIVSCDDFLEEDIRDDAVNPFSPLEGDQILGNSVNFQWSFLDGADSYRLQILASDANTGLVVDSLVTATSLNINLPSGLYSWSIRGENFAYETSFSETINFEVLFSDSLDNQSVQLLTPSPNFFTNTTPITFTWSELEAATSYNFQLQRDLNGIATILEENTSTPSIQPSIENFVEDAQYIWRVNAINDNSGTSFIERNLFLDRNVPETATLLSPVSGTEFNENTITFTWSLPTDTGNVQSDRERFIQFSQSETFDVIVDSFSLFSDTLDVTLNITGEIFWRVRIEDAAGNNSPYSEVRSFTIN